MGVPLNGRTYDISQFAGYGYLQIIGGTGLPLFPNSIFSDMLAELGKASSVEAIVWSGLAIVATNVLPPGLRIARAYTVGTAILRVGTAPTGASLIVVVKKNGATFTTLTLTASSTTVSNTGLALALAEGDILTFDITQIGSTLPGADLAVALVSA